MVNLRLAEFERKLEKCSRPPPAPQRSKIASEVASFKSPPEVITGPGKDKPFEISVKNGRGEQRLLDVRKFFDERAKRFIFSPGDMEFASAAANYLFEIQKQFGSEILFNELLDVVEKLTLMKNGHAASIEFLQTVAMESGVDWKREAIIRVMPAFASQPITESFALFGEIGEKTITAAARQIVELGYRLKEKDAIEKLGEVITALNRKFGSFSTYDCRANLLGIAKNEKINNENRALLVNVVSDHILGLANKKDGKNMEEEIELFNRKVSSTLSRSSDPETAILELCNLSASHRKVIKYLSDRRGKKPEAAITELFAKLAYEFDIDDAKAKVFARSVLSLESGLINKASEAVAFSMATGGEERAEEMAETVISRINGLPKPMLHLFLRDFAAFVRTNFDADRIKNECNDPKWDELKVAEPVN